jgi:hypothetical protein
MIGCAPADVRWIRDTGKGAWMKHALKFGVLAGIVGCVYSFILYLAGQSTNNALAYLGFIILIAGVFLAQRAQGQEQPDTAGYGKMLLVGIVTVLVAAVIVTVYSYINLSFIDTEIVEHARDEAAASMAQQGRSQEEIDQFLSLPILTPAVMSIMGLVFYTIFGVVISLITAAITKKKTA